MVSTETFAPGGASTLLEVLDSAQEAGFTHQFIATPDGHVRCSGCTSVIAADRLVVRHQDRLEGASDAADELLVALVECPACGARGVLTLGYGPNASDADDAVLRRLGGVTASVPAADDPSPDVSPMHVLVAVDGSAEARAAAMRAFEMFGAGHDYSVVSVAELAPVVLTGYGVASATTVSDLSARADLAATRHAASVADALPDDADAVTRTGHPGTAICETARELGADLVVIGAHEHGFWDRLLDPPVGRYVTEHAPCPVLVVR